MQTNELSRWLTVGFAAASVAACAGSQAGSTMSTGVTTSAGDVAMSGTGMWVDSVGGTWMDTSGVVWLRGAGGAPMTMLPSDVSGLSDANIVAHLSAGDSLEIALSNIGATRGEHADVRDFAQRMVKEHSAHMRTGAQLASSNNITPAVAPVDTADARMAANIINQLASAHKGADFDKRFMRAEVMMHEHMLHDLGLMRPQATGAAQQLIDQTIPVVQKHLRDAQTVLYVALQDKAGSRNTATKTPPR